MNDLERSVLQLIKEINPQSLYKLGFDDLKERIFIPSKENIQHADRLVRLLKAKCGTTEKDQAAKKFLESAETVLAFDEPHPDIGLVSDVLSGHLIKEGIQPETFKKLIDQLVSSINSSLEKFEGRSFSTAIKILAQYQVIGAYEILEIIEKETKDKDLLKKISQLRDRVRAFSKRFFVEGFTLGEFEEVERILKSEGAELGREDFYTWALKYGFDYKETPEELEANALSWLEEDLPKLEKATNALSKELECEPKPEQVNEKLRTMPGVKPENALSTTVRIRPIIQALAAESIVGFNPRYNATVVETPSYLSPILPTGAAQDFDSFTNKPSQRFYITTDLRRAPPAGFADLVNLLVHEEYGHCLHASNTAARYAASPSIIELLPSLHGGTTSEGLAFQRELEFLEFIQRLSKKIEKKKKLTAAEQNYVALCKEFGGFARTLKELEFVTLKQRIIRFLRVIGDARINSGKQNLLDFLEWAEKKTGLSRRTVFYQIFPAHEGIFPGYATCYAVVGQEIREIQKPFKDNSSKMVKFNAYACSLGYPPRSIYIRKLRNYASQPFAATQGSRTSSKKLVRKERKNAR
jgi:hypothetical protein